MKVRYTTIDGRMTFEFDAQGVKAVFDGLAQVQEVFEDNKCGQCGGVAVLDKREHDGNAYYKKTCIACGAQLDFGQKKDGATLFVKRKDKDGNVLGKNGWYFWQKQSDGRY